MATDPHSPIPSPARRVAITPHSEAIGHPIEDGDEVVVVNVSGRPGWLHFGPEGSAPAKAARFEWTDNKLRRCRDANESWSRLYGLLEESLAEAEAENARLRSALAELVRLKGLKEQGGAGAIAEHDRGKKAAWRAAYHALYPGDESEGTTDGK